ncbi:unnamed protein product [Schistosoma rodhaini]|uniref:Uncharacterized protein n=1 Tax=Schistosoma rodhaini TaxID=6188 RepID=A0AA85GH79_9TREM|nr:unnamed protein product [Schistosoma rodhaini]
MNYNLAIYTIVTTWLLSIPYIDCAGILWNGNAPTTTTKDIRTTTKASRPITEKQGPFFINNYDIGMRGRMRYNPVNEPKLICTQNDGIIKCYYVNKGTSIQRSNGKKLLWLLLILNFLYLLILKY